LKIINYSDLYVHASDAESEAISCIEAFSCGKVPIISDSKVSATNHFALDPRCLFKAGKSESLRERIEYFIQHPEAKKRSVPSMSPMARPLPWMAV
jgi:glycosyltransferase involved in cell wall biosynthesis